MSLTAQLAHLRRTETSPLPSSARGVATALALPAAVLIGALAALPTGQTVLLAIAGGTWIAVWAVHWRSALLGLFLFIPVAAVPGILLQQQGWPTLLKEGLFLVPAYIGLALAASNSRSFRWPLSTGLTILLVGLVLIVIVQAIRVVPVSPLVALIGLKTWLFYLPLLIVPSAVFASVGEVQRFIRLLVAISLIPSLVCLIQFGLIAAGRQDIAYQWYGSLAAGATQEFAQIGVSDLITVHRIPSTFTFVTQFVAYCLVTTPFCLVTWMADSRRTWRHFAALATVLVVAAGFASGSRTFYLWGPIEIALIAMMVARRRLQVAITVAIGGAVAILTAGSQLVQLVATISSLGWHYLVYTQAAEFVAAYGTTGLVGIGAGLDTGASRYVLPSGALPVGIEGWYGVTFLELGLLGLVVVVCIWLVLLRHAWNAVRVTSGLPANPIAICAFVILLATVFNLYKGVSLQYDPLNVYFWSIAGLAIAIVRLTGGLDRPGGSFESDPKITAHLTRRG